jgi:hypothetical protein
MGVRTGAVHRPTPEGAPWYTSMTINLYENQRHPMRDRGPRLPPAPPPFLTPILAMLAAMAMFAFGAMVIYAFLAATSPRPAHAHDVHRPELDSFYGSLKDPKGNSCCQMTDCHPTQAEIRPSASEPAKQVWWAQLGIPTGGVPGEWSPRPEWIEIPPDKIITNVNPSGTPVICHTISWKQGTHELDPASITVRCFLPVDLS